MDQYDDHDTCDTCEKHSIKCWCLTGLGPGWPEPDEDEVCRTPDKHPVASVSQ